MSTTEQNTIIMVNSDKHLSTKTLMAELHKRHFIAYESPSLDTALQACQRCEAAHIIYACDDFNHETLENILENKSTPQLKTLIIYANVISQTETDLVTINGIAVLTLKKEPEHALLFDRLSPYAPNQAEVILCAMSDAVISINDNHRIRYMNPTALRLLDITPDEAYDQSIEHVLDLRDIETNETVMEKLLNQQKNNTEKTRSANNEKSVYAAFTNPKGRHYKVAARSSVLYSNAPKTSHVLVLRDITEKYTTLPKIQATENKYWALVNTTQLGYTILDKQGRVLDANDEFIRITGYKTLEDIIGTDARTWISDSGRTNLYQAIDDLIKTGRVVGMEVDFKATDGAVTPIEFNATIIKEEGEYYVLGIGRDISDRRKAEKEKELIQTQLRQAQKMDAIGQLTGGIAHDFNNVLASILGYTELSQQLLVDAHSTPYPNSALISGKLDTYLNAIHEAGTRARDLVKQLMVFSRGGDISPQYMRVEPAVHEIIKLLSSTLPKTINVSTHFEKNLPLIHIDPIQLHQVIMNLCINSRDALNEVGDITISVTRNKKYNNKICASCHSKIADDYITVTVKDNGPGIAEQHRDRVFEPFYTTKTIGQGTGMGLSMVHGIMHEHGGHIILETDSRHGSAFHLLFPITDQTIPTESRPTAQPLPLTTYKKTNGYHIVIVEDEERLASFLTDLFSNHGYKVTAYTNSRLAQKALPKMLDEIDLILTDHTMPGITGLQLAKEILALRPDLPIILCTGFSFKIDEKTAYAIGISRFLQKPISTTELLKAVELLLASTALSLG
jgi:PAS domain S-box-containing protein